MERRRTVFDRPNRDTTPALTIDTSQRSLRTGFSWILLGNAIYAACLWGIAIALAKFGNPEMLGGFALAAALTTPIMALFDMQLRSLLVTDSANGFKYGTYLKLRLMACLAAISVTTIIVVVAIDSPLLRTTIMVMIAGRACNSILDLLYGGYQRINRLELISISLIAQGTLSLVGAILSLLLFHSLILVVSAVSLAHFWVLLAILLPKISISLPTLTKGSPNLVDLTPDSSVAALLKIAWPMGLVLFMVTLNSSVPQLIGGHLLGEYDLGLFAAAWYIVMATSLLSTALGQSLSFHLAQWHHAGDIERFRRTVWQASLPGPLLGIVGAVLALLFGDLMLTTLYSAEFSGIAPLLASLALSAGFGFTVSILGFAMTSARSFHLQVPLLVGTVLVNVLLSWTLVSIWGTLGLGFALLGTNVFQMAGSIIILRHELLTSSRHWGIAQ